MSLIETRSGGNATGLPFGVLSRRAAMLGAVTIAGFSASFRRPVAPATLIGQAASPASADAELVAHANRIVALAQRCEMVADHRAGLEDRVSGLCPQPDPLPKPPIPDFMSETSTPTGRILHIVQHHERDPAWVEWEKATTAAKAAHKRQEMETAARLGLPEVQRRSARMERRQARWASDLATMQPTTIPGVSAKVGALLSLVGDKWLARYGALDQHADLVMSALGDVVRLGTGASA